MRSSGDSSVGCALGPGFVKGVVLLAVERVLSSRAERASRQVVRSDASRRRNSIVLEAVVDKETSTSGLDANTNVSASVIASVKVRGRGHGGVRRARNALSAQALCP